MPDVFTDGAIHLLALGGVDRFSIRALARWMGVTPAYLLNDYTRARLLEIICLTFAARWTQWSVAPITSMTPLSLPATPDECVGVRARSGLTELAEAERLRGHPEAAFQLEDIDRADLYLMSSRLRADASECCQPVDDDMLTALALTQGLRTQLAQPEPTVTWERARTLVERHAAEATAHRLGCPGTEAA